MLVNKIAELINFENIRRFGGAGSVSNALFGIPKLSGDFPTPERRLFMIHFVQVGNNWVEVDAENGASELLHRESHFVNF